MKITRHDIEIEKRPSDRKRERRRRMYATALAWLPIVAATASAQIELPNLGTPPPAQPIPQPRIRTVSDIRVEGLETASPSAVIAFSGIRIGSRVIQGGDLFADAVQNIYARRLFSDVKIYSEDVTDSTLVVIIAVKEYPRVSTVALSGNDEIDEEDLLEMMSVRTGDIVSPYELNRSEEKIRDKYAEEGYLFTKVDIEQRPAAEPNRVDLIVSVNEGPEVGIGSITFEGNSAIDDDDLRGAMEDVKEKSWWQFWRSSKFDRDKLAVDEERVVDHYRSRGYIDAEILGDSIWINPENGKADVVVEVSEGDRVYLRSLTVVGNEVYQTPTIRNRLDVEEGEPYDQFSLERNLNGNMEQSDVRSLYLDNGYLSFTAQTTEQRVSGDSIDVVIRINEGDPAKIRFVDIVGNTKTKDNVIRRELYTVPGDVFSKASVVRSLRNLANLNYFNPEKLNPQVKPVSADATEVDITYEVEERPSDTFNASLGISSQGLSGMLGLSFNNFSLLEPLFGGGGQILNLNAEFGTYGNTFSVGLTEPWLFGTPTSVGFNVFYQTQDLSTIYDEEYKIQRYGLSVTGGRRLRWPDDYFRLDGALRLTQNNISSDVVRSNSYRDGSEISLTGILSRTSIDNPISPTLGSRFSLPITVAPIGDAQYLKAEAKFDFYSTIAQVTESNPLVLYINGEFGYLNPWSGENTISPTVFYSMGGTLPTRPNNVMLRGYRDGSIGPIGTGNLPVGTLYSKTTAELRFNLSLNPIPIYALAFAEAGNVWGSFKDVDPFALKRSAGFGLRVMLPPIGLLGFDYGFGFDPDSFESSATQRPTSSGWHFHFQFGR